MSSSALRVGIAKVTAWAPGIETEELQRAWCDAPTPLRDGDAPPLDFLPAMLRRRCNRLSRVMLEVAHRCCSEEQLGQVRCVFASRYGALGETVALLESLARREPLSPTRFSHSVHNTQAGLFSVAAKNRHAATALAAGRETFAAGFLDAVALLHRCGAPVLFVMGEEPLPSRLSKFAEPGEAYHAVALLLEPPETEAAETIRFGFQLGEAARSEGTDAAARAWPDAFEFLRWWHGAEARFELRYPDSIGSDPEGSERAWSWEREATSTS